MKTLNVFETFVSLQGESTYSGMPCFFIRLAGCNLRCSYCDTREAWEGGTSRSVEELVIEASRAGCPLIEVTGGEPLMQAAVVDFLTDLESLEGVRVLVETNGSRDISVIPAGVSAIIDIKAPSSGQSDSFDAMNIERLRSIDEVKFVIGDRADYEWARALIFESSLAKRCNAVLFGAVYGMLENSELADWICEDRLDARLQVQLHKLIGHK